MALDTGCRPTSLLPLKHRLALLQERPPRLLPVFAAEGFADVGDFVAELAFEVGAFVGADHAAL